MQRTREELDTDEIFAGRLGPTRYRTDANCRELPCEVCGETFFVNDDAYEKAAHALELDPADSPFCCEDCEADYSSEEHDG